MNACACGCGASVRRRFQLGHHMRVLTRPSAGPNVVFTGVLVTPRGYLKDSRSSQFAHRQVVERVMGKPLPKSAVIHHVNGDKRDNRPENLVVCESQSYHHLLHQRQSALAACGNPNHRKCAKCGAWGDCEAHTFRGGERHFYHAACRPKNVYGDWKAGVCGRGHDVADPQNVYVNGRGKKSCVTCRRLRSGSVADPTWHARRAS